MPVEAASAVDDLDDLEFMLMGEDDGAEVLQQAEKIIASTPTPTASPMSTGSGSKLYATPPSTTTAPKPAPRKLLSAKDLEAEAIDLKDFAKDVIIKASETVNEFRDLQDNFERTRSERLAPPQNFESLAKRIDDIAVQQENIVQESAGVGENVIMAVAKYVLLSTATC